MPLLSVNPWREASKSIGESQIEGSVDTAGAVVLITSFFSTFALHVPLSRIRIAPVFWFTQALVVGLAALDGAKPSNDEPNTKTEKIEILCKFLTLRLLIDI
jgi:hypothetical protein